MAQQGWLSRRPSPLHSLADLHLGLSTLSEAGPSAGWAPSPGLVPVSAIPGSPPFAQVADKLHVVLAHHEIGRSCSR